MDQVIYADILFLIDVTMDFFALYVTAAIIKARFKSGRTVIAAALGGIFSVLSVIVKSGSIIMAIAVSFVMCFITFYGNKLFVIFKSIIIFYCVNMLLGGIMTFIFNAFTALSGASTDLLIFGEIKSVNQNMPLTVFIISLTTVIIAVKVVLKAFSRSPSRRNICCEITLCGNSEIFIMNEDSGNTLTEPISGEPIVFLSENAAKKIANNEYLSALKLGKGYYLGKDRHKFRIAVYGTVNGSGICSCIKPERLNIDGKDCQGYIAIGSNIDIKCDGIVPSALLI